MSKFDEALETYKAEMTKIGITGINDALLTGVAKALGPSIYNTDSSLVSSSDQEELDRVKNNFLIKKLGLADGPDLDKAIKEVVDKFGSSNRNKHRAVFYYLLAQKFGKEAQFIS
ncbi:MAG: DUF2853 family protein [Cytophagales bacterium]|jgi:hypothetical protein|nr:DUF2853 family protein [Cytophagales bacterium]